ncbi:DUF6612 family protein [Lysinibacillus xylanilyticus]|uniref:DUF6612 family protein n=1 Tax=Lysinibacillus xylanilyticus TaxID=582475 RepID=UPI003D0898F5
MKKKILQCFMLVLVLLLIACSKEESEDTIEEVSEGISKTTVINNVLEQTITSYKMKMESTGGSKTIGSKNEQLLEDETHTMDMAVQKEPFLIYYNYVDPEDMTKAYIDSDSEYYNLNNSERWYKISQLDMAEKQEFFREGYLKEDIRRLLEFEDIIELQSRENEYILIAKVTDSSDKKSLAFVTDYIENNMKMELDTKRLKITINEVKYTLIFDKDFLLKSLNIITDINLYEGTSKSNLYLNTKTVYSDVNNVRDFLMPEGISKNAINTDEFKNKAR